MNIGLIMSKNSIIKGTLILTLAGFTTRLIGFFYRIFLSNSLGAKNLGIYSLAFPIYGICFTLYGSGIQTAISQLIAAEQGKNANSKNATNYQNKILKAGILLSLSIALCLSFLVYGNAQIIATKILLEPECAGSLRVLSYVFPFCGITACINGYYLGLKKAGVPAATQLLEQVVRVTCVYVIAIYFGGEDRRVTCELAMFGVVLGEIASNIFNILSLLFQKRTTNNHSIGRRGIFSRLIGQTVPLTGNRLVISILHSFEAILIPSMLQRSGLSNVEALSIFGILNGMAIPFILFPSTITNAFAVLLLPTVSEAQAKNNNSLISRTSSLSIKYSIIIGILSTAIFIIFGDTLGTFVFHNKQAGIFITVLSWLCPLMYLTTTLGSILNGLGKAHLTFFNSVIGISIRIVFILFLIPSRGIYGYLIGLLVSQLAITLLDLLAIWKNVTVHMNSIDWILKPSIVLLFLGFLTSKVYQYILSITQISGILILLSCCMVLCICFIIMLFLTRAISIREFRS